MIPFFSFSDKYMAVQIGVHILHMLANNAKVVKVVDAGAVVPCVNFLSSNNPGVTYEAAGVLSALSMNYDTVHAVVDSGAIGPLGHLLCSPYPPAACQAARALGFIGRDKRFKGQVTKSGCVDALTGLFSGQSQVDDHYLALLHVYLHVLH